MYVKDKNLLEKGYRCLLEKLGEEKTETFFSLLANNQMGYQQLKELADSMEAARQQKKDAAAAKEAARLQAVKEQNRLRAASFTPEKFQSAMQEYAAYLSKQNIRSWRDSDTRFTVYPSSAIRKGTYHIDLIYYQSDGYIHIDVYIGRVLTQKKRAFKQLVADMEEAYPELDFYDENFKGWSNEITVMRNIEYSTVEQLHTDILSLRDACDKCGEMAIDEFGESFESGAFQS